jgi:cell division protein FtsB
MKKLLAATFVALLMVGCGEDGKSGSDSSESNQSSVGTPPVAKTTSLNSSTDLNSSMLISCGACGKKISRLSQTCVGCGHPIAALRKSFAEHQLRKAKSGDLENALRKSFAEHQLWKAKSGDLEKELSDLKREVENDREFLDRLRRDPDFQDAMAREELGFGKSGELNFRFPKDEANLTDESQEP